MPAPGVRAPRHDRPGCRKFGLPPGRTLGHGYRGEKGDRPHLSFLGSGPRADLRPLVHVGPGRQALSLFHVRPLHGRPRREVLDRHQAAESLYRGRRSAGGGRQGLGGEGDRDGAGFPLLEPCPEIPSDRPARALDLRRHRVELRCRRACALDGFSRRLSDPQESGRRRLLRRGHDGPGFPNALERHHHAAQG